MFKNTGDDTKSEKLIAELKNYNIYDLVAKIASLNIIPQNQNKCAILDTVLNLLLSQNPQDFNSENIIGSNKLKNLINAWIDIDVSCIIDPIESPFVQRIQFYGNRWIFSGINTSQGFILQNFIDVLFRLNNGYNPEFLDKVSLFFECILTISTNIVNKMGYSMDTLIHYEEKDIIYPNNSVFEKATNAITFNISDISKFIGRELENELEINFSENNKKFHKDYDNYNFFYHPFLKTNKDTLIVLNPAMLIPFSIHYVILLAEKYDEKDKLIKEYNSKTCHECRKFLEVLGHEKINEDSIGFECYNTSTYKEMLVTAANDGILFVRFFCDDAKDYKFHEMFKTRQIYNKDFDGRIELLKTKIPEAAKDKVYQLVLINNFGREMNCSFEDKSNVGSIILNPFELQCISINENKHKFFLPRYLESKNNIMQSPFMNLGELNYLTFYAENNYSFYANDDVDLRKTTLYIGYGDSIDYINKALKKEDRQLIDYPHSDYLKEIIIYDEPRKIYSDTSKLNMSLINRFKNVDIWNICECPESLNDLNIKTSLLDLISFWLSEFKLIIENARFEESSIIINNVITGKENEYLLIKENSGDSFRDLLAVDKINDYTIQINWTPQAYHVFIGNEHNAEKELLNIIIDKLSLFTKEKSLKFDECIFENKLKTKMYSLNIQKHPYYNPIIGHIREIPIECIEKILNEIGDYLLNEKGLPLGIISENKDTICTQIVGFLYDKLKSEVNKFSKLGFYECIYHDLEIIMYQMMLTQKRYAADLACYPEKSDLFEKAYHNMNDSSISLKFLLEYIAACPPQGNIPLGEMDYEYLLSICSLIVEWAHSSDLFHYKMIDNDLEMLGSGRIGFKKEKVEKLANSNLIAAKKKLNEISNPYIDKFFAKDTVNLELLDKAFSHENGYTFTEFSKCINELISFGESLKGEIKKYKFSDIVIALSKKSLIKIEIVEKIINDLSLTKREDFLKPKEPFDKNDVYPWKFNRRLSFNRRPLIKSDDIIIWGNRQLYHTLLFTYDIICDGRYKAISSEMKSYIGQIANNRGECFNNQVYEKISKFGCFIVRKMVKKINGVKIANESNQDLGDIDVLVINPKKRKIIVIETKDFSFAKSPYELNQQYSNIFCDKDKKLCHITRHKKRVDWIEKHVDDIIKDFSLEPFNWKVEDALVVSEPIVSNEFYNKNQKIILFSEISESTINKL